MSATAPRIFKLEIDRATGSLERVLGVARRRGMDLARLSVVADGLSYQVRLEAGLASAEAALALAQLNALIDVKRAVMEEQ
ncbi:MAG: hypothetical protein FJ034_02945 [Chloroflexi bacterium]|nr:hypothetical protein [Chloroflexota bacterium]